ncbi:MAG TPA: hypothetical protein VGU23_08485 [Acidobacteriaceae bacterium]|nr:hypothetical protein [Acidobacteriaceae bacterium]
MISPLGTAPAVTNERGLVVHTIFLYGEGAVIVIVEPIAVHAVSWTGFADNFRNAFNWAKQRDLISPEHLNLSDEFTLTPEKTAFVGGPVLFTKDKVQGLTRRWHAYLD